MRHIRNFIHSHQTKRQNFLINKLFLHSFPSFQFICVCVCEQKRNNQIRSARLLNKKGGSERERERKWENRPKFLFATWTNYGVRPHIWLLTMSHKDVGKLFHTYNNNNNMILYRRFSSNCALKSFYSFRFTSLHLIFFIIIKFRNVAKLIFIIASIKYWIFAVKYSINPNFFHSPIKISLPVRMVYRIFNGCRGKKQQYESKMIMWCKR